MAINTHTLM